MAVADSEQRSYNVPAGDLGSALIRFAGQAGVSVSVEPGLVSGRRSAGLSGNYSIDEGFARLLQGSGLQLQPVSAGAYTLVPVPVGADTLNRADQHPRQPRRGGDLDGERYWCGVGRHPRVLR
ncbi:STN domain-containing protein [Pseudomonas fluorescens]|uniref:STN domain-containing protein n=1 Tax=Pseudomonas fluorescens TaxID=294 RepID=UPI00223AD4E1|nr:STN domain-containing protein [Pseudomonas fluorescens]